MMAQKAFINLQENQKDLQERYKQLYYYISTKCTLYIIHLKCAHLTPLFRLHNLSI